MLRLFCNGPFVNKRRGFFADQMSAKKPINTKGPFQNKQRIKTQEKCLTTTSQGNSFYHQAEKAQSLWHRRDYVAEPLVVCPVQC